MNLPKLPPNEGLAKVSANTMIFLLTIIHMTKKSISPANRIVTNMSSNTIILLFIIIMHLRSESYPTTRIDTLINTSLNTTIYPLQPDTMLDVKLTKLTLRRLLSAGHCAVHCACVAGWLPATRFATRCLLAGIGHFRFVVILLYITGCTSVRFC